MHSLLRLTALAVTFLCFVATAVAQDAALLTPAYQFSKKKPSYITLKNGKEIEGKVKDFDRKRGMTNYIKIEATDGKTYKLDASDIKHAYLYPSAFSRIGSFFDDLDAQRWDKDLNEELFKNGYVYMETTLVQLGKRKKEYLLMQLLNPHFSEGVRIYDDPLGSESQKIGIGVVKLAGGNANSYYIKKTGDRIATYLHRGRYKKDFSAYFSDCPSVLQTKKPRWSDLADHAYTYATTCAEAR